MLKANYEVEVLVNGKPLKEYAHDGKVYIEGRRKTVFSLRLRNNSYSRKLFVPTIDGLSVMDGKDASYKSSGYIVRGNSSMTIDGWRMSDSKVAEFYFSEPGDSYRKRMKKGDNLGIIGCAVFDEKDKYVPPTVIIQKEYIYPQPFHCTCPWNCPFHPKYYPYGAYGGGIIGSGTGTFTTSGVGSAMGGSGSTSLYSSQANLTATNTSASSNPTSQASQALGTGWGGEKRSEVVTVEFDQKETPAEVFEIFYNTREQLQKIGVNFDREPHYVTPTSFPGQFCEPPKNN